MRLDLGDITIDVTATVKGLSPPRMTWRIGPVSDTTAADRKLRPTPQDPSTPPVD